MSWIWISAMAWNRDKVVVREPRVVPQDFHVFSDTWKVYENRCWKQYLQEADDSEEDGQHVGEQYLQEADDSEEDGQHVFFSLQNHLKKCRDTLASGGRAKDVEECHYRIKDLMEVCMYGGFNSPENKPDDNVPDGLISNCLAQAKAKELARTDAWADKHPSKI